MLQVRLWVSGCIQPESLAHFQEGQVELFIRGMGSSNNDFSSDPGVATHYNGVYIGRPRGIGPME